MPNMLNFILTAAHKYRSYERYIEQLVKQRYTIEPELDWSTLAGAPLQAYIVRGAWVVTCDATECNETLFYEPGKGYFCPNCLNASNQHKVRPVIMPEQRAQIEFHLLLRPNPQNRNWMVGETIEQLIAENQANGIEGIFG